MKRKASLLLYRALVIAGGGAMLLAVAVELLAVLGRQSGLPVPGSIELVQVLVALSGSTALVVATARDTHARVRFVVERVGARHRAIMRRVSEVLSAAFFAALFLGTAWLAVDLWASIEESEIWRIPYRPVRAVVALCCLVVVYLFLRRQLSRGQR